LKKAPKGAFLYTLTIRFVQNRPCLPDVYPPKRLGRKALLVFQGGGRLPFRLPIFSRRFLKRLPLLQNFLKFPKIYGGYDIAYLNRFCNIFSVLHKGRILTDALLNELTCINKRKSRRNTEEYTMPQNRKRKFQKGE